MSGKLRYRHLSDEGKALARKLVEAQKENEINRKFELILFHGDDTLMGVMPMDTADSFGLSPNEFRIIEYMDTLGLVSVGTSLNNPRNITVTLLDAIFDAVDGDFSELEPSSAPTFQITNQGGQVGINTGSGNFSQTQTVGDSVQELRAILERLNLLDEKFASLLDDVEADPSPSKIEQLTESTYYKLVEIVSNVGGASGVISVLAQIFKALPLS